ncbi:hypothetical protein EON66_00315 [archaeon]|nr:MAG: hypothetical protein EON66_00315 [archaeon]
MNTDFLLVILRELLAVRHDLHLIIMSATMKTEHFVDYFTTLPGDTRALASAAVRPLRIDIPGAAYPVTRLFLADILHELNYGAAFNIRQENFSASESAPGAAGGSASAAAACADVEVAPIRAPPVILSPASPPPHATKQLLLRKPAAALDITCIACGRCGFATEEEFGVHIIECDGVMQLDATTLLASTLHRTPRTLLPSM